MIIRTEKTKNYTTIANFHLEDNRLSLKAKGLLTYFLSRPDYWKIYIEQVEKTTIDGKKAINAAIDELIENGYMIKTKKRENGKQGKNDYTVFEKPNSLDPKNTDSHFGNLITDSPNGTLQTPQMACFRLPKRHVTDSQNGTLLNTELNTEINTELNSSVAIPMPATTKKNYNSSKSFKSVGSVLSSVSPVFKNAVSSVPSSVSPVFKNSVGSVSGNPIPDAKPSHFVNDSSLVGSVSSTQKELNPVAELCELLPEKYQHNSITAILQHALEHHSVDYIKRSIEYTTAKSKGDPPQYTSYLKKCLANGWAMGQSAAVVKIHQAAKQNSDAQKLENLRKLPDSWLKEEAITSKCPLTIQVLKERGYTAKETRALNGQMMIKFVKTYPITPESIKSH